MSRFVALSSVIFALSVGCAPSNPGLVIDGLLFPSDDCTFDPSSSIFTLAPILDTQPLGSLDPGVVSYQGTVRVTNRLLSLFNNRYPLRADPNVMSINYAEIEILQVDGTPYNFGGLPNPFRVVAAGTIPAGTSAAGVPGITGVQIIPSIYGDALAGVTGTILISMRITATTSGAATLTSGEYLFPMELCANCLIACDLAMTSTESACLLGQDRVVTLGADLCGP